MSFLKPKAVLVLNCSSSGEGPWCWPKPCGTSFHPNGFHTLPQGNVCIHLRCLPHGWEFLFEIWKGSNVRFRQCLLCLYLCLQEAWMGSTRAASRMDPGRLRWTWTKLHAKIFEFYLVTPRKSLAVFKLKKMEYSKIVVSEIHLDHFKSIPWLRVTDDISGCFLCARNHLYPWPTQRHLLPTVTLLWRLPFRQAKKPTLSYAVTLCLFTHQAIFYFYASWKTLELSVHFQRKKISKVTKLEMDPCRRWWWRAAQRPLSRLLQLFCKESLKVCTKVIDRDKTL